MKVAHTAEDRREEGPGGSEAFRPLADHGAAAATPPPPHHVLRRRERVGGREGKSKEVEEAEWEVVLLAGRSNCCPCRISTHFSVTVAPALRALPGCAGCCHTSFQESDEVHQPQINLQPRLSFSANPRPSLELDIKLSYTLASISASVFAFFPPLVIQARRSTIKAATPLSGICVARKIPVSGELAPHTCSSVHTQ
ncbi:unnamed protein product [Pleuronectes platessa]|uniref:Uncharacterized protein n=1 Tax=Pleuronectes platessa TaxID=8262 RepID=A0A9N7YWK0_PLEPL|nr:unnamed protein product [Pleuronectes platessa]